MAAQFPASAKVAEVFDGLAETYDRTGVPFFKPVGARLVSLLDPRPGERALDIGCGRGAATLPLADAVGPDGRVDAVDVSPAMVAAAREAVGSREHVHLGIADVADLTGIGFRTGYDVIAGSLVIFLEDPGAALRHWTSLLTPKGRLGLTTFSGFDDAHEAIEDLFLPWLPVPLKESRTSGRTGPFATEEGMESLCRDAGLMDVHTVVEPSVLEFVDVATWRRFSMSTGQRALWQHVPDREHAGILEQAGAILDSTRDGDGPARLVWQIRYTVGRA